MPAAPGSPRELLGVLASRTASVVGDQLARVALSALVFDRTGSPLLAALVFAATYLPALLGTALLGGLADRLPRRRVLVVCDVVRAALVLLMAVPGQPVAVVMLLVLLVTVVDGPSGAARSALLRQLADDDDRYQRLTALDETCTQTAQVGGFVLGGLLLVVLGPSTALLLNAVTFVASALLLTALLRPRPAADDGPGAGRPLSDLRLGWRSATAPAVRLPLLLTWCGTAAAVAPEALALPLAVDRGWGVGVAGLLLAAGPVGGVAGLLLLLRTRAATARRALGPLVALALAPLLLVPLARRPAEAVALVLVSGLGLTYTTVARTVFAGGLPEQVRGRAFAVAGTGLIVGQGAGFAVAGLLAELAGPGPAVALSAAAGLLGCAACGLADRRARRPVPVPA